MFELPELYRQVRELTMLLHEEIKARFDYADVDNALVCAKMDLRYWQTLYRTGRATTIGGIFVIEAARDALAQQGRAA